MGGRSLPNKAEGSVIFATVPQMARQCYVGSVKISDGRRVARADLGSAELERIARDIGAKINVRPMRSDPVTERAGS